MADKFLLIILLHKILDQEKLQDILFELITVDAFILSFAFLFLLLLFLTLIIIIILFFSISANFFSSASYFFNTSY